MDSMIPQHSWGEVFLEDTEFTSAPPSSIHKVSHLLQGVPVSPELLDAVKNTKREYSTVWRT